MIGLVAIVVPSFSIARLCVAWSWLAIVNVYWPALRLLLSSAIRKFFSVTLTATGCAASPAGEEEAAALPEVSWAALPEVSWAAAVVVAPPALVSPELSEHAVSPPRASASARTAPRRGGSGSAGTAPRRGMGGDEPVRTDTVPPRQPAAGAPDGSDPLPRC